MNQKQFTYYERTKSINNSMGKGMLVSLIVHSMFMVFLITTHVAKKKYITFTEQKECEKILKVVNIKVFNEPIKKQIVKNEEKKIIKKDLRIKPTELIVKKIEMENIAVGSQNIGIKESALVPQEVMQNKANTDNVPIHILSEMKEAELTEKSFTPSKIVLSESAFDSKGSMVMNFNQSEVMKGKKTWIGNAIGSGALPVIKNSQKIITKLQNMQNNADSYNSTYNVNAIDLTSQYEYGNGIYEASKLDKMPEVMEYVEPIYPELARKMGIEGKVLLKLLINHEGKVKRIETIGNLSKVGFEEQAAIAVKKWKFSTPTVNGNPVSIWFVIPLAFSLN
ncbi:energy transducer TonB [Candidatus Poribacteria bacterium]|nr:energy transducer TonB [Candidatus Poribacteria bacterium]